MKRCASCWFVIVSALFFTSELSAKVRILTFCYNRPDFIELQHKTLKKFLLDDHELIVFNDASTPENEKGIQEMCDKYGIQCVRFQQEWHISDPLNNYLISACKDLPAGENFLFNFLIPSKNIYQAPSVRHSHVIQYALDHFGYDHNDIVAIMDSDAFFTRPVSLRQWLKPYDMIGINHSIPEIPIEYLWVIFIAFDPRKLPDVHDLKFHVDVIDGHMHDTGAHSYQYLKKHPSVKAEKYLGYVTWDFWRGVDFKKCGFNEHDAWLIINLPWPNIVEFHMNNTIVHFRGITFDIEGYALKIEYLKQYLRIRLGEEPYVAPHENPELFHQYEQSCNTPSEIHEHVHLIRLLAHQCSSAVEIGLKDMSSSWGILQGLSENTSESRSYLGIDTSSPPMQTLSYAKKLAEESGISFRFWQISDLYADIKATDMLFLNSLHTYRHLTYELEKFAPKVAKYIIIPNTSAPKAFIDDPEYRGDYREYPPHYDRFKKGIWPALEDFLERHPEWDFFEQRFNNNGFTVLRRLANRTN